MKYMEPWKTPKVLKLTNLMISQSSSTVLVDSSPPSDAAPSLGGKGMLTDDCLLAASWALS